MSVAALALAVLMAVQGVPPPPDQQPGVGDCAPRPIVMQYLSNRMRPTPQSPVSIQITGQVEGLVREDISNAREWVTIITNPMGMTCIVAMGERS